MNPGPARDTNKASANFTMKKTVVELIQNHIRALGVYVPGKSLRQAESESGIAMIKMASNENPFGPSPLAREAVRAAATEINFYPDNDATELRQALADSHGEVGACADGR